MNIENRSTKIYIKSLPPLTALRLIDKYKIPSPYKEVLITVCVERKDHFSAIWYLADTYNIHLSYRTFSRRLKEALEMFRESHKSFYKE